jgi:hypothetical protein
MILIKDLIKTLYRYSVDFIPIVTANRYIYFLTRKEIMKDVNDEDALKKPVEDVIQAFPSMAFNDLMNTWDQLEKWKQFPVVIDYVSIEDMYWGNFQKQFLAGVEREEQEVFAILHFVDIPILIFDIAENLRYQNPAMDRFLKNTPLTIEKWMSDTIAQFDTHTGTYQKTIQTEFTGEKFLMRAQLIHSGTPDTLFVMQFIPMQGRFGKEESPNSLSESEKPVDIAVPNFIEDLLQDKTYIEALIKQDDFSLHTFMQTLSRTLVKKTLEIFEYDTILSARILKIPPHELSEFLK